MPNDPPYGGYIIVREDGSVLWQVSAREFPKDRDTDGTLEYAIRVVEKDRTILSSRDGKCLLNVRPKGTCFDERLSTATSKFLIVSGYDTPETPDRTKLVGKSYYITGNCPLTGAQNRQRQWVWNSPQPHPASQPTLPPYDLFLHYDDYDLERAGLKLDMQPDQLSLCYQHSESVRRIWKHYRAKPTVLTDAVIRAQEGATRFREHFQLTEDMLKTLLVWSLTYHHLAKVGIPEDELGTLNVDLNGWDDRDDDIWLSRWKQVHNSGEPITYTDHQTKMTSSLNWAPQNTDVKVIDEKMALSMAVMLVDQCFGYQIGDEDLTALDPEDHEPISRAPITCQDKREIRGARTIVATELTQPGTFILMCHINCIMASSTDHAH